MGRDLRATTLPAGELLERGKHLADKPARCFFVRRRGTVRTEAAGGSLRRGKSVKILLPETEPQGLAGGGEQTAP